MLKRILYRKRNRQPPPARESTEAKRNKLAEAAYQRQSNWRQKSSALDPKDRVIASIRAIYSAKGKDPPIGLPSSSLESLQRHLRYIKNN